MSDLKPMTAHRALYFMERFKKEEKLLGPNEQAAVDFVIAMLEAQAQPAQAGQVLTDEQSNEIFRESFKLIDSRMTPQQLQFVRAIESAVLARVARVPMTEAQIEAALWGPQPAEVWCRDFRAGVRAAERHHGIVGEKGGA